MTDILLALDAVRDTHPRLVADLIFPANGAESGRPLIMCLPGGWWHQVHRATLHPLCICLAERGWPCAAIGLRRLQDVPGRDGREIVSDVVALVRKIRDESLMYDTQERPFVLLGHESGATLAMLAGRSDRLLAAGLSGVIGISGLYNLGDLARLDPEIRNQAELFCKADPSRLDPNRLQAADVQRTLFIHGADDQKIPAKPVDVLTQRLKTEGAEVTSKILPGAGHRLLDDPRSGAGVQVIDAIASWLMPKAEDDDVFVGEPNFLRR